jgi:uncharacterized OB-fold protein
MSAETKRPVPPADTFTQTAPFWAAAREKKLFLQVCADTGRFQHFPRPVSLQTGSRNLEWREVSGRGEIYACTVLRAGRPDMAPRLPLPLATITLEEGVRIVGNIVESSLEDLKIGRKVALAWDMLDGDTPYPAFRILP